MPTAAPTTFNAADHLVARHLREGDGARTAVVTPTRSLTYAELDAEVRRVAAGLLALDVRPEERVLMCMVDEVELFASILATMLVGAVAVPSSTMLTGHELHDIVVDARARVVIGSADYAAVVRVAVADAPDVRHVVLVGADPGGLPSGVEGVGWSDFLHDGPVEPYATWPDSPALWLYTSGTTGVPKAAMHRHGNIRLVAEAYAGGVLGITRDDRCLSVAKLFFAYGIGNSMFFPLTVGATAVLEPSRPNPKLYADRIAEHGVTL
ncbi:MAG: AMP-binding protein, partial [Umezawaea sp.]